LRQETAAGSTGIAKHCRELLLPKTNQVHTSCFVFERKCDDPHLVHANTLRLGNIALTSSSTRRRTLLTLSTDTHHQISKQQQLFDD
jgi:hypothetical protein